MARRSPACRNAGARRGVNTPRPVWNPDVPQPIDSSRRGRRCPTRRLTTTASRRNGRCSSAICSRTRRSNGRCSKAPRACSSPRRGCRSWKERRWIDIPAWLGGRDQGSPRRMARDAFLAGRSARSRATVATDDVHMPTLNLPIAGGRLAPYTTRPPRSFPAAKPPFNRIAYAAAHVVADPLADADPWLDAPIDWDAHHRLPPPSVVARPRRRRGDGHRAARHGPGLAELAGADPPEPRRREGLPRRADRLRAPAPIISRPAPTSPSTT